MAAGGDAAGRAGDATGPDGDAARPAGDATGPTEERAGPTEDAAGPTEDAAGPTEDAPGPTGDLAGPDDGSTSRQAAELMALLGLSEDELCQILDADPLTLLSGQLEHRPELPILMTLIQEAYHQSGGSVLQRWVRATGPAGRPLDALMRRDFAAFEDALAQLSERGFVLRGGA